MKTTFQWLVHFFLICSLLFFFSLPDAARGGQSPSVAESDQAPNFTMEDLNGNNVMMSDYKGKTVLLLFMTTWIHDCWKMIPHMKEIYSLYNSKGLVLFNVDIMESKKKAERFANEYSVPYPTLLDKDGEVSRVFGVMSVPLVVLINSEGRIICWNCSSLDRLLERQFGMKEK